MPRARPAPAVRPVSMVAEGVAKGTAADTDCAVDDVDCSIEDLLERNRQYRQAPFKKLMAATRAEIAVRIERAARELNMQTAAIYGIEDAKSQHRWGADQSFLLEKADPNQPAVAAYLDIEQIVKVAKENGVDAIHPGYGFLSENPDFAKACEREGIKFVGPTVDNLITFADKTSARIAAIEANVPVVPGTDESLTDFADVKAFVDTNGLPIIIKAAMGGGGKGMRVVREMSDLQPFFESAQSEAKARPPPPPPPPVPPTAGWLSPRRPPPPDAHSPHSSLPPPSSGRLRRRLRLPRVVRRGPAPHRGADHRRRQGRRRPPVGARLLGAAPPPEGGRDRAGVEPAGVAPRGAPAGLAPPDEERERPERGHRRVPRRQEGAPLLHRGQPAHPGRAHGDGGGDGDRPRPGADDDRWRRRADIGLVQVSPPPASPSSRTPPPPLPAPERAPLTAPPSPSLVQERISARGVASSAVSDRGRRARLRPGHGHRHRVPPLVGLRHALRRHRLLGLVVSPYYDSLLVKYARGASWEETVRCAAPSRRRASAA